MARPRQRQHRPRYGSFLTTGALIGLLITVVVLLGPGADVDRRSQLFFYLGMLLAGTGALIGGLAAVVLEGRHESAPSPARDDGEPTDEP